MMSLFKYKSLTISIALGAILSAGFFVWQPNMFFLESTNYINNTKKEEEECLEGGCDVEEKVAPIKVEHLKTPESVKGIYMSSWVAGTLGLRQGVVDFIKESELNAVVIDIKDDTGQISFEVFDPALQAIGSEDRRISDIRGLINELHLDKIYVIGRISVFQDPYLAKARPDLAVKTKAGAVWKDYKGLAWLDPCAEDVWDYIIKIAEESEKAGFDELNFDYIRFPSDGNMRDIAYPFCDLEIGTPNELETKSPGKADLLENFFRYLSDNLKDIGVPISADLFGMVTVNTDDLNIGQVLEQADPYFDYLAPMVYPSHYPKGFNGYNNPADHPYEIIYQAMTEASKRLIAASSTPQKLRPWIQDFDLGAIYTKELVNKQKEAVYDAGLLSWTAWDASNKYTKEAY